LRRGGFVLLVLVACFMSLAARFKLDPEHESEMLMDMAYLPNGRMLGWISGGMDNMLSDLLWLRSLRYVMDHFNEERDYTYLYKAHDIITDLDPNFEKAYRFGAYFLSGMTDEYANARDLLKKGWKNNPGRWRIAYDLASVYDLHLKEPVKAADWFIKAAECDGCPRGIGENATLLYQEEGRLDRALAMWTGIAGRTKSEKLKKVAEWNVKRVRSQIMIEDLNDLVERYKQEKAVLPASLKDLEKAGLVPSAPRDGFGESVVYTRTTREDGKEEFLIECREMIRRELDKRKVYLRNFGIRPFRRKFGRWPESMKEMIEKGILAGMPQIPHGIVYDYDPETGELSFDKTLERYSLGQ
jgi:DNA-binding transcriptional ArsR family regulator